MQELFVRKLSEIAADGAEPFAMNSDCSCAYTTLRARKLFRISPPLLQAGAIDFPKVANFSLPEIAVASFRNCEITPTGSVIVNQKFLVEETLEGDFKSNGLIEQDGRIFVDTSNYIECDTPLVNFCKFGTFNYSIFLVEISAPALILSLIPGVHSTAYFMHFPKFMGETAKTERRAVLTELGYNPALEFNSNGQGVKAKRVTIAKVNDRYRNHRVSQALPLLSSTLRTCYVDALSIQPTRIYIRRSGTVSRKLRNYEEIEPVLEKFGIFPVALEDMSVVD